MATVRPDAQPAIVDPENPAAALTAPGVPGRVIFVIAVAFSLWQVFTSAYSPFSSIVIRSVHVGFLLLMTFALFRAKRSQTGRTGVPWHDWVLGGIAFALSFYHWIYEADLIQRAGDPSDVDIAVGVTVIVLLFEAARRVMGLGLPIFCAVFIPYALFGRYLPEPFLHRGFEFGQVVDQLYLGTEGIYGTPTFVSSTYIFLFILFGAFLERAGMIRLFNDVALGTVGHAKGGPAKVSVISSGFMGTINGSGVANVLTTGQFTIPLMQRFGYRPAFAGAVEATASMGGQIMPPVMGAVAFIMAETLNVPYSTIAITAIIPAVLYYFGAFWMVHLEAGRHGLMGLPKEQCPSALGALRRDWYLILPLAALVYMLFSGYTPLFAGTLGLALTVILILGKAVSTPLGAAFARAGFWIALGIVAGAIVATDSLSLITTLFAVIGALLAGAWVIGRRDAVAATIDSLAKGAKSALGVGIACALVGIIVGTATLTGLASEFARMILVFAGDSMFLALVLTMLVCLLLGTGVPTIPNYIITSAMAAPALLELGVPLIVSHMFVFYFGIMADLTPPVALAALAASSITKTSYMRIGFIATRIAIAGYVVPYMAVYDPALMLQGDWTVTSVAYIVFKAVLGICLWGGAVTGYLIGPMSWIERAVALAAAALLVVALPITDEIGLALSAAFLGYHYWRSRQAGIAPA